ncbi:hypothetical protein SLS64_002407 [Diaporthe eres]
MATLSKMSRANNMQLFHMLPKNGLYYEFWYDDDANTHTVRRILPAIISTKIMIQLHKKYNNPTKGNFDHAITALFDSASATITKLANGGKNPSYEFNFWSTPKAGTIFENVSDRSTYRFAIKMLEARKRWIERQPIVEQPNNNVAKYECKAAKAIDRFNSAVDVAAVASAGVTGLMNGVFDEAVDFTMDSCMIGQFNQFSDTEEEEEDDDDVSDDEGALQPRGAKRGTTDGDIEAPAAKRVKLHGDADFEPALVSGTAKLALGGDAHGTGDFGPFLAQLAKEDEAQLDEEDMMEMDGY